MGEVVPVEDLISNWNGSNPCARRFIFSAKSAACGSSSNVPVVTFLFGEGFLVCPNAKLHGSAKTRQKINIRLFDSESEIDSFMRSLRLKYSEYVTDCRASQN